MVKLLNQQSEAWSNDLEITSSTLELLIAKSGMAVPVMETMKLLNCHKYLSVSLRKSALLCPVGLLTQSNVVCS